ncbi:uncharacterized protein LOC132266180 [Phlebotomus argentipes]|uniref:uncharacterized protein LOC132266180 n=1 Tax=Phlebotomus argentipes TaxID=94469 RepID=UPI0028930333|nr:uncharacterized protein LOC132266180 [Phlebotomus argentipes]
MHVKSNTTRKKVMKISFIFLGFLLVSSVLSFELNESGIYECYVCDSTDLEDDKYEDCDTHYKKMGKQECIIDDRKYHSITDYVCYRAVFFHIDEGYVIMRGCEVKDICNDMRNYYYSLNNRSRDVPVSCHICNTTLCDPLEAEDHENDWVSDECHHIEQDAECIED